jgi:hypothetical protein
MKKTMDSAEMKCEMYAEVRGYDDMEGPGVDIQFIV